MLIMIWGFLPFQREWDFNHATSSENVSSSIIYNSDRETRTLNVPGEDVEQVIHTGIS